MADRRFRVFISSPSDVFAERERVERVITRLNGEFGGALLEAIRWERSYYTATKTFQDQIPLPSETDLVICILWKRLGFELPPDYRRPDGTTPTGTEYEFEDAMQAARAKGTPDVLVYRKSAQVLLDAEQIEIERAQFEALKHFWTRWFRPDTGHFTAAYQTFETTDQFETQVEAHVRQWLIRHEVAAAEVTWPIELRGSPFRGLQPFDAAHAAVFFGRRRVIERARERLTDAAGRGAPFLLILGTSGSGKSSLARAGLAPRLTQPGAVPGVDVWRSCVMRPSEGDGFLNALARTLYGGDAVPELAQGDSPAPSDMSALLGGAPDAAARALRLALGRAAASVGSREGFQRPVEARLLLVVDQFEEALTPATERDAFARALTALAATGAVWIIATLRSDLYALFQASPLLTALRDGGAQLDLLPPEQSELAEIVAGPAAAAGLKFDRRHDGAGLDEELAKASDQPGALPLLQLVLDALFEGRDPASNTLTWAAYDALGGLSGVIERRAEATLSALDAEAAAALPSVLRALVEVGGEGVIASRAAAASAVAPGDPAKRLVAAFVAARLLVADTRGVEVSLRVAHDALLSGWPRAARLLESDREMLRTRFRVEAAARLWTQEGRDADFLLPAGRPLAEAVELLALRPESLDPAATTFIEASRQADAARAAAEAAQAQRELRLEAEAQQARADAATKVVRRTRLATALVSTLLVATAAAAVFANFQRQEAERQTAQAERNFQAALNAGAGLIEAVNAHLRDGGMTRRVAGELLGAANTTMGGLSQSAADSAPLRDAQSRLQAAFSGVQLALCDSGGARARAAEAVALAERVFGQSPTDERKLALALALDTQGRALRGDGDPNGAGAAYRRAEALARGQAGAAWEDARRLVRRDMATSLLDLAEFESAQQLLQDDLAWQQSSSKAHPNDPAAQGLAAIDLRGIAFAKLGQNDLTAAEQALGQEAETLRRLQALQPTNLEWQRAISINIQQVVRILLARGDTQGALARSREAAALASSILEHDPDNAEWQRDLVFADIRLGQSLARSGDLAGTLGVLRPAVERARSLTDAGANSQLCRGDAARLHDMAGNALTLTGDNDGAVNEFEASLAIAAVGVAAAPNAIEPQHNLVAAEAHLAQALWMAGKPAEAAPHYRAGIALAARLIAGASDNMAWQGELHDLRLGLGDALRKAGDLPGALAAYAESRAACEALAAAHPDDAQWRHRRVVSLLRLAGVELLVGDSDAQWAALQAATQAAEALVAGEPGAAQWREDLIDVRENVAVVELGRKEFPAALAHFREALALADALVAENPGDTRRRLAQAIALTYVGLGYKFNQQLDEAQDYTNRGKAAMEALQKKPATH